MEERSLELEPEIVQKTNRVPILYFDGFSHCPRGRLLKFPGKASPKGRFQRSCPNAISNVSGSCNLAGREFTAMETKMAGWLPENRAVRNWRGA